MLNVLHDTRVKNCTGVGQQLGDGLTRCRMIKLIWVVTGVLGHEISEGGVEPVCQASLAEGVSTSGNARGGYEKLLQ